MSDSSTSDEPRDEDDRRADRGAAGPGADLADDGLAPLVTNTGADDAEGDGAPTG